MGLESISLNRTAITKNSLGNLDSESTLLHRLGLDKHVTQLLFPIEVVYDVISELGVEVSNHGNICVTKKSSSEENLHSGTLSFNYPMDNLEPCIQITSIYYPNAQTSYIYLSSSNLYALDDFLEKVENYYTCNYTLWNGSWRKRERYSTWDWDNLFYPEKEKRLLQKTIEDFLSGRAKDTYEKLGICYKKGILLVGPQGVGKTSVAKIIDSTLDVPVLYVTSFENHMCSESPLIQIYTRAKNISPCVVWMEDIDLLLKDSMWYKAAMLSALDGLTSGEGILTIATTNHPEKIDPALLQRPSRFDKVFLFKNPNKEEREKYLGDILSKLGIEIEPIKDKLSTIAKKTENLSYSHLQELVIVASNDMDQLEAEVDRLIFNSSPEFVNKLQKQFEGRAGHVGFRQE